MIQGKSVLAIIPARGGSKGIPRKNITRVAGRPLLEWTVIESRKSNCIDRLILSSEDKEIIAIAQNIGCEVPFVRPADLARDDTPGIAPVIHALQTLPEKYDYVVLLQPTSPLRLAEDIDGCLALCLLLNAPACITVTEPDKHPYWTFRLDKSERLVPLIEQDNIVTNRQNLPALYAINGAVYVARTDWLILKASFLTRETVGYVMPHERSIDVDTEIHLKICDMMLRQKGL